MSCNRYIIYNAMGGSCSFFFFSESKDQNKDINLTLKNASSWPPSPPQQFPYSTLFSSVTELHFYTIKNTSVSHTVTGRHLLSLHWTLASFPHAPFCCNKYSLDKQFAAENIPNIYTASSGFSNISKNSTDELFSENDLPFLKNENKFSLYKSYR